VYLQAREKARKDAAQFEAESLEKLSDMTKTPTSQLKFIKDAWRQVGSALKMIKNERLRSTPWFCGC
jgi:ariadne-1